MTFRKFGIIWLAIILFLLSPLLLGAIVIAERLLGFFPGEPGWYVAKIAAEKKNIEICKKIINLPWHASGGPSKGESRINCINEYASITNDPSVCERLLPSNYAIDCIGGATNFPQQECIQVDPNKLNCYITEKDILKIYDVPQIENCELYKKYSNHQVIHWCFGERAKKYGELDKCLQDASKDIEKDDCYYQRAMKLDDLQLAMCEKIISNTLMRGDCTETVKAWIQYPELRPKES